MKRSLLIVFFSTLFISLSGRLYAKNNYTAINGGITTAVSLAGGGGNLITVTSTVNLALATPTITAGAVTGYISACAGSSSASPDIQQFAVSGNNLTASVSVAAPAGFEVSLAAGAGYGNNVTLGPSAGSLNSVIIYVRSAATDGAGNIAGNVVLSSTGAVSQNVAVSGTVSALPTVNTINGQTVKNGAATTGVNFTGTGGAFTWVNDSPGIGLAASGTGDIPSFTAINNSGVTVTAHITVTPVNAEYAYVANNLSNTVTKINLTTNIAGATIQVGNGPISVCVSPDGSRAYVTNAGDNTVSVINTNSNLDILDITVGTSPQQIAISPDGSRVYVSNYNDPSVSVINTSSNSVIATINAIMYPNGIVCSPDGSKVYVANTEGQTISVINTSNNSVSTIMVGRSPTCLAISPDGSRVYTYNQEDGTISEVNTLIGTQILIIPAHDIVSLAVSKDGSTLYSVGIADNNLNIINTTTGTSTFVPVDESTHECVSLSANGNNIYLTNFDGKSVSVINSSTYALIATVPVGMHPIAEANSANPTCPGAPVSFSIAVTPASPPTIVAGPVTGNISACAGTASSSPEIQQFTVSGSNLAAAVTAAAPAGFEISLAAGSGYGSSVAINPSAGSLSGTTVYVRSAAGDGVGAISGNVVVSSTGAADQQVLVSGMVNALPTVNTVNSQTVINGQTTAAINFTGTGSAFTWVNSTPGIGLAASGTGNIPSFTGINNTSNPITAGITVTPQPAHFAYIPNANDNTVSVLNTVTNEITARIPVFNQPIGVALSPDDSKVYISSYSANAVDVIDAATVKVVATIPVTGVIGICVSADGTKLYAASADGNSNVLSVFNTADHSLITTITVGYNPGAMCLSPDGTRLYVLGVANNEISVVNTATNALITNIPVGLIPSSIAISPDGSHIYVSDSGSGDISVVSTATNALAATITGTTNIDALCVNADGSRLYACDIGNNDINVYNTQTNTLITAIPGDDEPSGISITPDGNYFYVTNQISNTISVIEESTNTIIAKIAAGNGPDPIGSFITERPGCTGVPQTFTITVNPSAAPVIVAGTAGGNITACAGTASVSTDVQQFTVSGSGLTTAITATAPPGGEFELSLNAATGFSSSLTIAQSGGTVGNTIIYVRSSATAAAGNLTGEVVLTSASATSQSVSVSGVVNAIATVNAVASPVYVNGATTAPINFSGTASTFSWTNDTPGIGLAASGTGAIPSFTAVNNTSNPIVATITVTPLNSANCNGGPVNFTITVNPTPVPPTLTAAGTLSPLTTVYGTPSAAESFTVSGTNLTSGILVTPPPGFEVSSDGVSFSATVTIGGTGSISSAVVYIRLASSTHVGSYDGNVTISTNGAPDVTIAMPAGTVTPAPLTVTADNKARPFGAANPALTVTFDGFVNNDGPPQLTVQPTVSTAATSSSPVGQYPISVGGADSPDYSFIYIPGVLTVTPSLSLMSIPNTFSPNGDGINDTWVISELAYYPASTVNIFNRWGQKVFSSVGYPIPWDGRYQGKSLPTGTYYYIIDPKNGQPGINGWVAIIH